MRSTTGFRVGAGVLAAGLALLLTACSDGGAQVSVPDAPDGWVRVEAGRLTVAVPSDWVELETADAMWSQAWSDAADTSQATVILVAAPELGTDGAAQGLDTFVAGAQMGGTPGYVSTGRSRPVETDTLEVERNDYTYTAGDATNDGVFWSVADPRDEHTIGLQLTGADLSADVIATVQDSIRVLPQEG
ncbi:hypothetical protein ACTHAM_000234 [Cellulomonas soli]|uniref:hypothetical protein n=1 Tax=Cellulomonas soli TaxID=931535 RepID=UPI003F862DF4